MSTTIEQNPDFTKYRKIVTAMNESKANWALQNGWTLLSVYVYSTFNDPHGEQRLMYVDQEPRFVLGNEDPSARMPF